MLLNFCKTGDLDWLIYLINCLAFDIVAMRKGHHIQKMSLLSQKDFEKDN